MLDVILRALRHPFDYIPVLNRRILKLQEVSQESDHIYSFIFKPKKPFTWKAGQHGIFFFPHTSIEGKFWRAFSIASSAEEGVIRISTIIKENPSDFKQRLKALNLGQEIIMHGPFGEFHTANNINRIVGIAGGIGITPFRPIIKDIVSGIIPETQLALIYAANPDEYTFKEELDSYANHPSIDITYVQTPEQVNAALAALIEKEGNAASYFISGSPGMINAIRNTCKAAKLRKIVNDTFKGY